MKSMQVSKGNTSVKNGYEAMTGQINVEYVKPEDPTRYDRQPLWQYGGKIRGKCGW